MRLHPTLLGAAAQWFLDFNSEGCHLRDQPPVSVRHLMMPDGYTHGVTAAVPGTPGGLARHLDFLGEHSGVQQVEKAKPRQPNSLSPGFATSAPQMA